MKAYQRRVTVEEARNLLTFATSNVFQCPISKRYQVNWPIALERWNNYLQVLKSNEHGTIVSIKTFVERQVRKFERLEYESAKKSDNYEIIIELLKSLGKWPELTNPEEVDAFSTTVYKTLYTLPNQKYNLIEIKNRHGSWRAEHQLTNDISILWVDFMINSFVEKARKSKNDSFFGSLETFELWTKILNSHSLGASTSVLGFKQANDESGNINKNTTYTDSNKNVNNADRINSRNSPNTTSEQMENNNVANYANSTIPKRLQDISFIDTIIPDTQHPMKHASPQNLTHSTIAYHVDSIHDSRIKIEETSPLTNPIAFPTTHTYLLDFATLNHDYIDRTSNRVSFNQSDELVLSLENTIPPDSTPRLEENSDTRSATVGSSDPEIKVEVHEQQLLTRPVSPSSVQHNKKLSTSQSSTSLSLVPLSKNFQNHKHHYTRSKPQYYAVDESDGTCFVLGDKNADIILMEDTPAPDSPTDRSIEDMYPSLVPISLDTIMPNQNLKNTRRKLSRSKNKKNSTQLLSNSERSKAKSSELKNGKEKRKENSKDNIPIKVKTASSSLIRIGSPSKLVQNVPNEPKDDTPSLKIKLKQPSLHITPPKTSRTVKNPILLTKPSQIIESDGQGNTKDSNKIINLDLDHNLSVPNEYLHHFKRPLTQAKAQLYTQTSFPELDSTEDNLPKDQSTKVHKLNFEPKHESYKTSGTNFSTRSDTNDECTTEERHVFSSNDIAQKSSQKRFMVTLKGLKNLSQVSLRGANTAQTSNSVAKQCTERNQYPLYMDDKRNDNPLVSLVRNSRHLSNNYSFGYQAKKQKVSDGQEGNDYNSDDYEGRYKYEPYYMGLESSIQSSQTDNNRIGSPGEHIQELDDSKEEGDNLALVLASAQAHLSNQVTVPSYFSSILDSIDTGERKKQGELGELALMGGILTSRIISALSETLEDYTPRERLIIYSELIYRPYSLALHKTIDLLKTNTEQLKEIFNLIIFNSKHNE